MIAHSWIRKLFPRTARTLRPAPARWRPRVEALEDRLAPATFIVNTLDDTVADDAVTSLREAITQANSTAGDDTIDFDSTVFNTPKTITLGGTQLELTDTSGTQTITGPAAGVTVSGGGLSRVFQVSSGAAAALSRLAITGGSAEFGSGLLNLGGTITLTNVTVSGNTSSGYGGGLYNNGGTLTLTNTTVANNAAGRAVLGGGLFFNGGEVTITNSTFSGNSALSGGGIGRIFSGGSLTMTNTIVAGQTKGGDISGSVSGSYNLIGDGAGMTGISNGTDGNQVGTNASPINPMLAPLGDYSGPTFTMPLLPGSPAIGAGTSTGAPDTDQRGQSRVGAVDIGAFESQGFVLTPAAGSTPQATVAGSAFANPLAVTVTANNPIEPVNGGVVRFTAPATGAAATLSAAAMTISGSQASVTATANAAAGSYAVTASAAGATPASFTLSNKYLIKALFDQTQPYRDGARIKIEIMVTDALSNNVGSSSLPVTAVSVVGPDGTEQMVSGDFKWNRRTGAYEFVLRTDRGASPGTYTFNFRIGDDPTLYSVNFVIG